MELCYEGCHSGYDALGPRKIYPLGRLIHAFVKFPEDQTDLNDDEENICDQVEIKDGFFADQIQFSSEAEQKREFF